MSSQDRRPSNGQPYVVRAAATQVQQVLHNEAAGGILLLIAAAAAILWVNIDEHSYHEFWLTDLSVDAYFFHLDLHLEAWVNDALMAIFFFVVGMEIKREMVHGELSSLSRAALPIAAAAGGMIVPAAIFTVLNLGGDGAGGWGIPMATDIAFAIGVLSLAGSRVPFSLKIFLLALAVADDLGAIAVIAIFYTDEIAVDALLVAAGFIALIFVMRKAAVRDPAAYLVVGAFLWVAVHESGIHATIAGVILGLLTPAYGYFSKQELTEDGPRIIADYGVAVEAGNHGEAEVRLNQLETLVTGTEAPLERLERKLHPWANFVILPLFALANAGLVISGDTVSDAVTSPVTAGIFFGLLLGKPIGIVLMTWLLVRSGVSALPQGVTWTHILGVGLLAGIGFTVALFVTNLAYDEPILVDDARFGIFVASIVSGVLGFSFLRMVTRGAAPTDPPAAH